MLPRADDAVRQQMRHVIPDVSDLEDAEAEVLLHVERPLLGLGRSSVALDRELVACRNLEHGRGHRECETGRAAMDGSPKRRFSQIEDVHCSVGERIDLRRTEAGRQPRGCRRSRIRHEPPFWCSRTRRTRTRIEDRSCSYRRHGSSVPAASQYSVAMSKFCSSPFALAAHGADLVTEAEIHGKPRD